MIDRRITGVASALRPIGCAAAVEWLSTDAPLPGRFVFWIDSGSRQGVKA